ncbi:nitroreductase [Candidatus Aerophobetes bacterium]|uniref:Nitroreductase n=1 Tax=Aerophobetes bacterium TaxID=2030807 RepID=A0A662DGG4_UNCAE|nr:MAG: nitroreductase [Candidatus Aerophobetes bacterium]
MRRVKNKTMINLPEPQKRGRMSVEEAINKRRSIRDFSAQALSLQDLSQLLWAAQGITGEGGFGRSCPSAGALYPLEIYVVVKNINGLERGIYSYVVFQHGLEPVTRGDYSEELSDACLGQVFIAQAPLVISISADYERITWKYGERGIRYIWIEAGHCGQNISLQAVSLGLVSVPVGAFWDREVKKVLCIPQNFDPVYVIPVGYPKEKYKRRN